jgi:hypothetical protein
MSWQFTGFDPDDGSAEYVDAGTGESYYHRPSWRSPPMNDEIKPAKKSAVAISAALTPMAMIEKAITSGAGIETLERLMTLQERWEANEARREYDAAIAQARSEIKPILKTREASFGSGKASYKYEDLADIAETVDEILAKYGLSYRWEAAHEGLTMIVTCIVSHARGHRERSSLPGRPDPSGNKNEIQALGSAVTYLQRYTLKAALGLAAARDDDAHAVISAEPASPPISEAQYASLVSYIADAGITIEQLLAHRSAAGARTLNELTRAQYVELEAALRRQIKFNKDNKAAAKKEPSSTDVATAEAAYQMGREAQAKGAGKTQWPGFWKDKKNIAEWQRGWSDAEDEMTSERAIDAETSRGND